MTTTAKPAKAGQKHNDWHHGPVAAAFVTSAWPLFITLLAKFLGGPPPWVPLVVGVVMAVCFVWAGRHRQPRPLSRVSLVYRAAAALMIGVWMWWHMATFPGVAIDHGQAVALLAAWPATIALFLVAAAGGRIPALIRYAIPTCLLVFAGGLTAVMHRQVGTWLTGTLTVTEQLPHTYDAILGWLGPALLQVAVIGGVMAVLGLAFANRERTPDEHLADAERAALRGVPPHAMAMQNLICKVNGEITTIRSQIKDMPDRKRYNLTVTSMNFWDNGAGETYIVNMVNSEKGVTLVDLRRNTETMATKLNLPEGCGVEVLPAKGIDRRTGHPYGRGFAAVDVCRVNVLEKEIPYPELRPRSIMNAMPLGQTRSGIEIGPFFRENSAFVWGQKGSGKTVTIFDIVAGSLQCTDCLVWVIDLNGGAAARPFLRAWAEGKVDRPCIDWVATTIEEVQLMAEVGMAIAADRKQFYADLKFQHDTNLMPVGNGALGSPPPQIMIIIDEGAEVLGIGNGGNEATEEGRAARTAMNEIMRLARDAAVNIVFSGLRATADVADTAFKAGTSIRIGMRVTDDQELAYGFGDYSLSAREIPYKGCGYISCGHDDAEVKVFKAFFLKPSRMSEIGELTTPWRPYLDARGQAVAGRRYANRWARTARKIWTDPRPEMVEFGSTPGQRPPVGAGAGQTERGGTTTAVLDRDDRGDDPIGPGGRTSTGTPVPPKMDSFEDIMRHAKNLRRSEAAQRKARDDGDQPDGDQPAGDQPPGGGEVPPDQPAGVPDGQEAFDNRFGDIVSNATVLKDDPHPWIRSGKITPDQELAAAPQNSRQILEKLVYTRGPLRVKEMHRMLITGGDWGDPVRISSQAMYNLLKKKKGSPEPAEWLADRQDGDPYDHRDRPGRVSG